MVVIGDDFTMVSISFSHPVDETNISDCGKLTKIDGFKGNVCKPAKFDPRRINPAPVLIKRYNDTCGECGHYTSIIGDPETILRWGFESF